jgi:hypothetical protein
VNPKVLPRLISQDPAISCAIPPYATAKGTTTSTPAAPIKPAFIKLSRNVVKAKPASPSGAGSAASALLKGLLSPVSVILPPSEEQNNAHFCHVNYK